MKKVLTMMLVCVMLLSLFAVNVSAAGVQPFYQDFENVSENDNKSGFSSGTSNSELLMREVIEDPYKPGNTVVKFVNRKSGASGAGVIDSHMAASSVIDGECMFAFDFIQLSTTGDLTASNAIKYVMIELSKGGPSGNRPRIGLTMMNYADGFRLTPENDVWYSYIAHVNSDFSSLALYRKERDSDEPYTFVRNQARGNVTGTVNGDFRIYGGQVDYMIDNICFCQGGVGTGGHFEMDGEAITELSQVTNGTLTATTDFISGDVKTTVSGGQTIVTDGGEVFPFAVVYDASGKMIDCVTLEGVTVKAGKQTISLDIDTSGFYDKLDGGYIGYYMWKDFVTAEPLMDAVELY